jgi:hypothetical protein
MKELADIATALQERHNTAKKVLAATSSSNRSARIQQLETRASKLSTMLQSKERDYQMLKDQLNRTGE